MTLKEKLLNLGIIKDNEYLNKYVELIENNRNTQKQKFKTQIHHIVPQCYYRKLNIKVDNSKENLVNLLHKDHILAHYYLYECANSTWFKIQNSIMVEMVLGKLNEYDFKEIIHQLEHIQDLYEFYISHKLPLSEDTKRKIGEANKIALKGKKHSKERCEFARQRSLGRTWYNNGVKNIFIPNDKEPPEGFVKGMILTHTTQKEWMANVHRGRTSENYNTTGGKIVINNSKINKYIKEEDLEKYLKEGWKKGKLPLGKLNWYNNGVKNTRAYECPEGYVLGRLITEETRKNLGNGMRGKQVSQETKQKISNKLKKTNNQ